MAEEEIVRLRRRDGAGWWGGQEAQLIESQAAQQSGFGGTMIAKLLKKMSPSPCSVHKELGDQGTNYGASR